MSDPFDRIYRDLGEIRRRARSIEAGAVRGQELTQHAREIAELADRLVRIAEDAQREGRRTRRSEE